MNKTIDDTINFLNEKGDYLNLKKMNCREFLFSYMYNDYEQLEPFPDELKTAENKISKAFENYVSAELIDDKLFFKGTADVYLAQCFMGILIPALNGLSPKDIMNSEEHIIKFKDDVITQGTGYFYNQIYNYMKNKTELFLQ
ncbi:MAG: SufE family protein [archaeon]